MLLSLSETAWISEWQFPHLTNTDRPRFITLLFIEPHRCCFFFFLQRKARPSASKKITAHFIATFTLWWCSGTDTVDSPQYTCNLPIPPLSYLRLCTWKSRCICGFPAWLVIWIPSECFRQNKWHPPRTSWIPIQRCVQWCAFLKSLTGGHLALGTTEDHLLLKRPQTSAGTMAETQQALGWQVL